MKNTVAQTSSPGAKCMACGITGIQAMCMTSLDRLHGCQGAPMRRHHFPRRQEAQE